MKRTATACLCILTVTLALVLVGGPAGSHVTDSLSHLKKHLNKVYAQKTKVHTKEQVYTKEEADNSFLSANVIVINERDSVTANNGEIKLLTCPDGYQALSGGWTATSPGNLSDNGSAPLISGHSDPGATPAGTYEGATGWYVRVFNFTGTPQEYGAAVVCARSDGGSE